MGEGLLVGVGVSTLGLAVGVTDGIEVGEDSGVPVAAGVEEGEGDGVQVFSVSARAAAVVRSSTCGVGARRATLLIATRAAADTPTTSSNAASPPNTQAHTGVRFR